MNIRKMNTKETEGMFEKLKERFGLDPKLFQDYDFFINTKNKIFILNKTSSKLVESYPKRLMNVGILFARKDAVIKPTSNMLQIFGHSARKNIIELNRPRARIYIEGFDIDFREEISAVDGYVILRYGNNTLGCGLLKDFALKNVIPKAKRMRLKYL